MSPSWNISIIVNITPDISRLGSLNRTWQNRHMTNFTHLATIKTNHGDIKINLLGLHAPKTVANFVGLADGSKDWTHPETREKQTGKPLYDGVIFHRVIEGFMIQAGDPLGRGTGGPGYTFGDEITELTFSKPYILAMANAGPGTNGSQFFITVAPTPWLNGNHTIFGEVTEQESKDVVDAIAQVQTSGPDRPVEPVVIETISITTL